MAWFCGLIRNPILDISAKFNCHLMAWSNAHSCLENIMTSSWKKHGRMREKKRDMNLLWTGQRPFFHVFFFFLIYKTVIVYSLKHIQYLRWMEREISYTEWWSRHDCKLLFDAGLDPLSRDRTYKTDFLQQDKTKTECCCISHSQRIERKT